MLVRRLLFSGARWMMAGCTLIVCGAGAQSAVGSVTAPYINDFSSDINDFTTFVQPNDASADPLVFDGEWVHNAAEGFLKNRTGLVSGSQRTNSAVVQLAGAAGADVELSVTMNLLNVGFSNNTTVGLAGMATGTDLVADSYYFFDFRPRTGLMRLFKYTNGGTSTQLATARLGGVATDRIVDNLDEVTDVYRDFVMDFAFSHVMADDGMGGTVPGLKLTGTLTGWSPNGNQLNGDPVEQYTTSVEYTDTVNILAGDYFGMRNRGGGNTAVYEVNYLNFALTAASAPLPGDFNGDGAVNGADLTDPVTGWQARFGVDLDGSDYLLWQRNLGAGAAAAAAGPVPAPAAWALALCGAGAVRRARRKAVRGAL